MYKLHYKLTVPKFINKRVLLIASGAVVVLALLSFGIVWNVQASRVETAKVAQEKAVRADYERSLKAEVSQASLELTKETAKADAACTLLKQYATAKTTAKLVTYPQTCNL